MRCARSMDTTTRDSEISFTVFVFGTSTSMPDCRIGAVIMKITSRTSMTSTKRTMLISEREVPVWRASWGIVRYDRRKKKSLNTEGTEKCVREKSPIFSMPSVLAPFLRFISVLIRIHFLDDGRDFQREAVHAPAGVLDVVHEMVVGDHCGHGGEETRRRRNQCLGDAGRNCT